jgi:hypothetical protein
VAGDILSGGSYGRECNLIKSEKRNGQGTINNNRFVKRKTLIQFGMDNVIVCLAGILTGAAVSHLGNKSPIADEIRRIHIWKCFLPCSLKEENSS